MQEPVPPLLLPLPPPLLLPLPLPLLLPLPPPLPPPLLLVLPPLLPPLLLAVPLLLPLPLLPLLLVLPPLELPLLPLPLLLPPVPSPPVELPLHATNTTEAKTHAIRPIMKTLPFAPAVCRNWAHSAAPRGRSRLHRVSNGAGRHRCNCALASEPTNRARTLGSSSEMIA